MSGVIPAWCMKFVSGHHGTLDRVGGLPSHLPPAYPIDDAGQSLRFLAQFYGDDERLNLPAILRLQIYQATDTADSIPVPVLVPFGANPNEKRLGRADPLVIPHHIEWEYREDPDEPEDDQTELAASKLGERATFRMR